MEPEFSTAEISSCNRDLSPARQKVPPDQWIFDGKQRVQTSIQKRMQEHNLSNQIDALKSYSASQIVFDADALVFFVAM